MKAIRLIQQDYNNMENNNPYSNRELGIFIDEPGNTAYNKVDSFIRNFRYTMYIGCDNEVYPKFKLEIIEVL